MQHNLEQKRIAGLKSSKFCSVFSWMEIKPACLLADSLAICSGCSEPKLLTWHIGEAYAGRCAGCGRVCVDQAGEFRKELEAIWSSWFDLPSREYTIVHGLRLKHTCRAGPYGLRGILRKNGMPRRWPYSKAAGGRLRRGRQLLLTEYRPGWAADIREGSEHLLKGFSERLGNQFPGEEPNWIFGLNPYGHTIPCPDSRTIRAAISYTQGANATLFASDTSLPVESVRADSKEPLLP